MKIENPNKKNVLIVDDEELFLRTVSDGLSVYSDEFNLLTANNGKKAIEILKYNELDLVVTDLKMPVMDGFQLLAYMSREHPEVSVIVMTAFGTPEIERKIKSMDVLRYLEKPLDMDVFSNAILDELLAITEGYMSGITLPAFLQMVEMEAKTCTLKIRSNRETGYIYFNKGRPIDAKVNKLIGEDAVYEILDWDAPEIEIKKECKKKKRNINSSLAYLVMEGIRLKDERRKWKKENRNKNLPEDRSEINDEKYSKEYKFNKKVQVDTNVIENSDKDKFRIVVKKGIFDDIALIRGFVAACVYLKNGELVSVHAPEVINTQEFTRLSIELYKTSKNLTESMGLGTANFIEVQTDEYIFVHKHIVSKGADLGVILTADGNIGLLRFHIKNIIEILISENS